MRGCRFDSRWMLAAGLGAVLSAFPAAIAAPTLDAGALVERIQEWLDGTRDMQARFEQTLTSGALGTGLEESGRMYLGRPGRMRWDYLEPEKKVALIDGDSTRLYLEEDQQLWEGRLESGSLLAMLLADAQPLDTLFEAELLETPEPGDKSAYRLQLVPRTDPESFREIVLTLRPPRFAIDEVEVLDAAGNRMHYRFLDLRRNRGISASVFGFEPPPGTEIVRP